MTVKEFLGYYNTSKDKEGYLKKVLSRSYVPYEEKITLCNRIVETTMTLKLNDGTKIFHQNSASRFMLFVLVVIDTYTKIDVNFSNILEDFNALDKNSLVEEIVAVIPQKEYSTFGTVLNMCLDDYEVNERGLISYIDNKIAPISKLIDTFFNNPMIEKRMEELFKE